ncbi:MAG: ATP-binding cassette domain-containing protein [Halobacteriota archaeon]|jgi:daunorubicin resistance ABC transporter ATP-binding subunit
MVNAVETRDLVKRYEDVEAIKGITLDIEEGEFFGFLGPNGAGKSTTIKVLTTLLRKTSGSVTIEGFDIDKDAREIRKVIGVQSQETILDGDLTGRENLTLQGHLQRLHGSALKKRVDELLTLVELSDVADKRAAHYSGGMKKRLDLASTLVHKPRVLFLDEPTTGLDPQSRIAMWEYLETLNRDEGVTIFLTTQQMEEADMLCQRLAILDHGEIVVSGSPVELKHQLGGDTITMSFANGDGRVKDRSKRIVSGVQGVTKVLDIETGLAAYAKNASALVPDIVRLFDENEIRLTSINVASASLDDVFLQHTGRRIRSEELSKVDTWKNHV